MTPETLPIIRAEAEWVRYAEALWASKPRPPRVFQLPGDFWRFITAVFPGLPSEHLMGQVHDREPRGRGAHWDDYGDLVSPSYPWIAVYNLEGDAQLTVCRLRAQDLQEYSQAVEPFGSQKLYQLRRLYSRLSLAHPETQVMQMRFPAGSGLILPMSRKGPAWVHGIRPLDPQRPGRFVKCLYAASGCRTGSTLGDAGYRRMSEITRRTAEGSWELLPPAPMPRGRGLSMD